MKRFVNKVIIFGAICWALNMGIGAYLKSYETYDLVSANQFYPVNRWNEFYQQEQNIDLVILGSSHAFRSYHPGTIEQNIPDVNLAFNMGSAAQSPKTSYFLLREILDNHQPKYLIFDLYYLVFTSRSQLKNGRINLNQMQKNKVRSDFYLNGFSFFEKLAISLFPSFVYKEFLNEKINKILGRPYLPRSKGDYIGKGFVSSQHTTTIEQLQRQNQFDGFHISIDQIAKEHMDYLNKIDVLCANNKIQLILSTSPIPEISVLKIENYETFYNLFKQACQEMNRPFFDFNIERVDDLSDSQHYFDDDHLNEQGAKLFSKHLCKRIRSTLNIESQ